MFHTKFQESEPSSSKEEKYLIFFYVFLWFEQKPSSSKEEKYLIFFYVFLWFEQKTPWRGAIFDPGTLI